MGENIMSFWEIVQMQVPVDTHRPLILIPPGAADAVRRSNCLAFFWAALRSASSLFFVSGFAARRFTAGVAEVVGGGGGLKNIFWQSAQKKPWFLWMA